MNFNELKPIFATKTFNILANLTDNPTCDIYLKSFDDGESDPFDQTSTDSTTITQGEDEYLGTIACIYTYDKLFIQESETLLGSKYTLILYVRADDLPLAAKNSLSSVKIKFNDVMYNLNSHLNLYNILYEFNLK